MSVLKIVAIVLILAGIAGLLVGQLTYTKATHEAQIGPLDEGFGLGLFEDDDYILRIREAGYRVVCAEDVLVHHFGESSFGKLVPTGEYGQILEENRDRFHAKWGVEWQPYGRRPKPGDDTLVEADGRLVIPASGVTIGDELVQALRDADRR